MKYLVILLILMSGCGKAPEAATAEQEKQKKEDSFSCWLNGGKSYSLELPNDCNESGNYCIVGQDVLTNKDVKLSPDSCIYKWLDKQGALKDYSWGGNW